MTMTGKVAFLLICWISLVCGQAQYKCDVNAPCGCSTVNSTTAISRIIGGENAQVNSWPWMISLRRYGEHICGGSILNSQFILTAAHCLEALYGVSSTTILAGSLTSGGSGNDVQIRSVDRIIRHANYDSSTFRNDLGLLRLKTPLNLTGTVLKPICLPNDSRPLPDDNTTMIGIGWGVTSVNDWTGPSILQQVTVRSINRYLFGCPSILYHPEQQFCAGLPLGGKDTCQGDSGGPLMSFRSGRWYVDGLTSYGDSCALPNNPGVYTRVNFFTSWIQTTMNKHSRAATTTTKRTTTTSKSKGG